MSAAVITGANRGIGLALLQHQHARSRLNSPNGLHKLFAITRNPSEQLQGLAAATPRLEILQASLTDASAPQKIAHAIQKSCTEDNLHLTELYNVAGILHDSKLGVEPERKLEDLDLEAMTNIFAINTFAPFRLIGALAPQLCAHDHTIRIANWSARVGSITDNRLGGWYSYRASKAAQNSLTKSASIELARRKQRKGGAVCVAVHPGTVATGLSEPFQRNVKHEILTPEASSKKLLDLILQLHPDRDNGKFFAYDGTEIPW